MSQADLSILIEAATIKENKSRKDTVRELAKNKMSELTELHKIVERVYDDLNDDDD